MSTGSPPVHRKPWLEKSALVSGLLALLLPGLGHFYQGRSFKGTLYLVCILGTFFGGMRLGEGAVVYMRPKDVASPVVSLTFVAQSAVGGAALPAVVQQWRASHPGNTEITRLNGPWSSPFTGKVITFGGAQAEEQSFAGTVSLDADAKGLGETRGTFRGTVNGQPVEWEVAGGFQLERPIAGGFQRKLEIRKARTADDHPQSTVLLKGWVPRSLSGWYGAPPDRSTIEEMNDRLGKVYDLAIALTMIAGLLNVLAIWDAIEGPAYGFGDEPMPGPAT